MSAAHSCAVCAPQLMFGNNALTVGYFRVMKNGILCQNNDPIPELRECSGYCMSRAKYTSLMQGFSNNCNCCQPDRTVTKSIQLSCADGTTINKNYTVPETCHCGLCAASKKR
ncbi:hypothetical protein KUTeg_008350 [Tegillarca granosa]|uniref:CTCK domain-containing protein n=1 Tax=Tegillarca granosa TaxID=220873 RepID=A0ABQ9F8V8_TEGGR|nr:hypothetical protein KUTeg_008350 [Tegillarca granosa]